MPPRKRRIHPNPMLEDDSQLKRRLTKSDREKLIVKTKLDALEQEESLIKEDRFSLEEKRKLLDAYNDHGFHVFQNEELLSNYLPNRRKQDIKALIQRLKASLLLSFQTDDCSKQVEKSSHLEEWEKLCHQLMRNFAKDRKVNLDDILVDALTLESEELEQETKENPVPSEQDSETLKPNYIELFRSFSQLMAGKFPDNMSPSNAQISMQIFDHITRVVDSLDLKTTFKTLEDGTWLQADIIERQRRQDMAIEGLAQLDKSMKKCPSFRDLESNRFIESLCLELPKIKRITDVLNPLCLGESLVSTLMDIR